MLPERFDRDVKVVLAFACVGIAVTMAVLGFTVVMFIRGLLG